MTDRERLAAMRKLGVVWKKGRLPRYPSTMTEDEVRDADRLYDGMRKDFIDRMSSRPKPHV